jgi:thiol:disulfide interchange protein DsbA
VSALPKAHNMMNPQRRLLNAAVPLSLLLPGMAMTATDHSADGPFAKLENPHPTDAPGKIEVLEFLWYGCPHCAKVEPFIEAWKKKLPADVVFRREHIVWEARPDSVAHARLFATLKAMNLLDTHQQAVFDAVHKDRADFRKEAALVDWLSKRGIDRSAFDSVYKSFGVQSMVIRMKNLAQTYRVESVPTFFINGKYTTEPHRAGGEQQVLMVMDKLIAQERALIKK